MKWFGNRFTLIELLVVVAIIGIVASMILPSLSKAREKAKTAVCINGLKQFGIALAAYSTSNNDEFPGGQPNMTPHSGDFSGQGFRVFYTKKTFVGPGVLLKNEYTVPELYECPNEDTDTLDSNTYGFNKHFPDGDLSKQPSSFVRYSYHYQGNYKETGESGWGRAIHPSLHDSNAAVMVENFASYFQENFHHFDRITVLYLDGAAKSLVPPSDIRSRFSSPTSWSGIADSFRRLDR